MIFLLYFSVFNEYLYHLYPSIPNGIQNWKIYLWQIWSLVYIYCLVSEEWSLVW